MFRPSTESDLAGAAGAIQAIEAMRQTASGKTLKPVSQGRTLKPTGEAAGARTLKPATEAQIKAAAERKKQLMTSGQKPTQGPISKPEAPVAETETPPAESGNGKWYILGALALIGMAGGGYLIYRGRK